MSTLGTVGGVSDPVWFGLYLAGLVVAGRVVWLFSRYERSPAEIPDGLDDYDVALLAFGGDEHRAVSLAMLRLQKAGVLDPGDATVRERAEAQGLSPRMLYWRLQDEFDPLDFTPHLSRVQPLPPDAHPVEHAVYEAAADSSTAGAVRARASCSPLLSERRQRLFDMDLLLHCHRNRVRECRWLLWAVYLAVGAVILRLAKADGPSGWNTAIFILHVTAGLLLASALSIQLSLEPATRTGRRVRNALYRQAEEQIETAENQPSLRRLALAGFDALWENDPALALALHLPNRPKSHGD